MEEGRELGWAFDSQDIENFQCRILMELQCLFKNNYKNEKAAEMSPI